MKLADVCKTLALVLALSACAAQPQETQRQEGVEDLTPGERSVISAPSRQDSAPDRLGERNI